MAKDCKKLHCLKLYTAYDVLFAGCDVIYGGPQTFSLIYIYVLITFLK